MRTVFFGTPEWAVPSLEALLADPGTEVSGVVTNPDRPAGRGMELRAPPVKRRALEGGLEVRQPGSARDPGLHGWLQELGPDVAVIVAYGKILPGSLLQIPAHGFVNVHFSLLPAYRGAAPVQRAIVDGAEVTGVSIMVLTEGMDEGPVLARRSVPIGPRDTAGTLGAELARVGAALLVPTLHAYLAGDLRPVEQDHARATLASKLTTEEARIDWSRSARDVHNLVRGLNPAPGAWTTFRGERVKVLEVAPTTGSGPGPGEIAGPGALVVGTGDGVVEVIEAQAAGRRRMSGAELARGLRPAPGERFE